MDWETKQQSATIAEEKALPGKKQEDVNTRGKRLKRFSIILVFALVFALGGIYLGKYSMAKKAALNCDYEKAKEQLLIPQITQLHDPSLLEYVNALENLMTGNVKGYKTIVLLAENGYEIAKRGLADVKEQTYKYAVNLYRQGQTYSAEQYFTELKGYKRSADYLALINAEYNKVITLIGFEDAKEILLEKLAYQFLLGNWETKDGNLYFSLEENNGSFQANYNLPHLDANLPNFSINKGVFSIYDEKAPLMERITGGKGRINLFRFTIFNAGQIKVYCYKDENSYVLYRQY